VRSHSGQLVTWEHPTEGLPDGQPGLRAATRELPQGTAGVGLGYTVAGEHVDHSARGLHLIAAKQCHCLLGPATDLRQLTRLIRVTGPLVMARLLKWGWSLVRMAAVPH
jgi:hypothetical protein